MTKSRFPLLAVCLLGLATAQSQPSSLPSIAVLAFECDSSTAGIGAALAQLRNEALQTVLRHGHFAVVERAQTASLEAERELQKSESFLDGKTVEQSRAIGADFLLSGFFETKTAVLSLKITDVAQKAVVASSTCALGDDLKTNGNTLAAGPTATRKLKQAVAEMLSLWAAQKRFAVVRILEEKGDKARLVLLAGGSAKGVKKGMDLEVFIIKTEEVDGEPLDRFVAVGKASVAVVENANFSQAKISDGGKELRQLLASGKKIYCRIVGTP